MDIIRLIISALVGGLLSTGLTLFFTGLRAERELTISFVEGFSSLEAHRLRTAFWSLVAKHDDAATFEDLDGVGTPDEQHAFRFVLGFFTNAGALMREDLLNEKIFFSLSERWMREMAVRHFFNHLRNDRSEHYEVHRRSLMKLQERWAIWDNTMR